MIYVISVGGSLIAPKGIDTKFIKRLKQVFLSAISKGDKFLIIPGGGQTCRNYQDTAKKMAKISNDDLDWIGIKTNHLHSYFLRAVFGNYASPGVISPDDLVGQLKKPISICLGGIAPGGTSDSTAVRFAEKFHSKIIINLTNVNGIYDRDPRRFRNSKLIQNMTWDDLKQQFGSVSAPGRHVPFDASAASKARRLGIKVVIMNGNNLKYLTAFLKGRTTISTTIT